MSLATACRRFQPLKPRAKRLASACLVLFSASLVFIVMYIGQTSTHSANLKLRFIQFIQQPQGGPDATRDDPAPSLRDKPPSVQQRDRAGNPAHTAAVPDARVTAATNLSASDRKTEAKDERKKSISSTKETQSYSEIMEARRKTLEKGCRKHTTTWIRKRLPKNLIYSDDLNTLYCAIPKVGSSFLSRVFTVMAQSLDKNPLDMSGVKIHWQMNSLSLLNATEHLNSPEKVNRYVGNAVRFMFTRNPYWKVFSAYVDKIFPMALPPITDIIYFANHPLVERRAKTNPTIDMLNISFSETLQYAMGEIRKPVDGHFLPPSSDCDVCHIHYDFIGKMETFNDDVRFILASLNKSSVVDAMGDIDANNEQNIITDVIYRTFAKFRRTYTCLVRDVILRRIWKHFQIRGLLNDDREYPLKKKGQACLVNETQFRLMAINALERSGDRKKRKLQRDKYFVQAFRSVPLEVLKRFRESVQLDCDMFGYDCSPDNIFRQRKTGDEEKNIFSDINHMYISSMGR